MLPRMTILDTSAEKTKRTKETKRKKNLKCQRKISILSDYIERGRLERCNKTEKIRQGLVLVMDLKKKNVLHTNGTELFRV